MLFSLRRRVVDLRADQSVAGHIKSMDEYGFRRFNPAFLSRYCKRCHPGGTLSGLDAQRYISGVRQRGQPFILDSPDKPPLFSRTAGGAASYFRRTFLSCGIFSSRIQCFFKKRHRLLTKSGSSTIRFRTPKAATESRPYQEARKGLRAPPFFPIIGSLAMRTFQSLEFPRLIVQTLRWLARRREMEGRRSHRRR